MNSLDEILLPYQRRFVMAPKKKKIALFSRQAGKSMACSFCAVSSAMTHRNGLSLVVSTGQRAAEEFVKKAEMFAEALKVMTQGKLKFQSARDEIRFSNGSRVISLPSGNPSALRGWTTNGGAVILDEAAFIPNLEDVLAAIAPTMTRCKDSPLIFASTPAGKNSLFYQMWEKALRDPDWYAQKTTIEEAAANGLDVDIDELRKLCPDELVWNREFMCEFMDEFGAWMTDLEIPFEYVEESNSPCWLGMDVGAVKDASGVVTAVQRNGRLLFDFMALVNEPSFARQMEFVRGISQQRGFRGGYVDAVGIGYGLAERLRDEVSSVIRPFVWTAQNKSAAYDALRSDCLAGRVAFSSRFKNVFLADARLVMKTVTADGKTRYSAQRSSQGHADLVSAAVLCHQAWRDRPEQFGSPQTAPYTGRFGDRADILGPRFSRLTPPF